MSEEEEDEDSYTRHPPSYRSKAFDDFINKLDQRLSSKHKKHPRLERKLGSPCDKPIPGHCKKWMVKTANEEDHESSQNSEGLPSDAVDCA